MEEGSKLKYNVVLDSQQRLCGTTWGSERDIHEMISEEDPGYSGWYKVCPPTALRSSLVHTAAPLPRPSRVLSFAAVRGAASGLVSGGRGAAAVQRDKGAHLLCARQRPPGDAPGRGGRLLVVALRAGAALPAAGGASRDAAADIRHHAAAWRLAHVVRHLSAGQVPAPGCVEGVWAAEQIQRGAESGYFCCAAAARCVANLAGESGDQGADWRQARVAFEASCACRALTLRSCTVQRSFLLEARLLSQSLPAKTPR